jgi:hypothetical protein
MAHERRENTVNVPAFYRGEGGRSRATAEGNQCPAPSVRQASSLERQAVPNLTRVKANRNTVTSTALSVPGDRVQF